MSPGHNDDRYTYEEWNAEAVRRFGDQARNWAFECPTCDRVQTCQEFRDHGIDHTKASAECIGRHVKGEGCDWAAYGLIRGPVIVTMPDGTEVAAFRFAEIAGGSELPYVPCDTTFHIGDGTLSTWADCGRPLSHDGAHSAGGEP